MELAQMEKQMNTVVVIVGAGPAGLATSACLNLDGVPNIVLEKEDCCASLWKKRAYDRLKLHLAKEFCELPHMPFPLNAPTYAPRKYFIDYLEEYASTFQVRPMFFRLAQSASFDVNSQKWLIEAKNSLNGEVEIYTARFLVVATGENSEGIIPKFPGLNGFRGVSMHSSHYGNGKNFTNKNVLVVGCGNSGMEIGYDLVDWGAITSIVIRNPVHVLTKEIVRVGMNLLKFLPLNFVDFVVVQLGKLWYGNLAKHGIQSPDKGPFVMKCLTGRSPVIDVGVINKIKKGEVKVLPGIEEIDGFVVKFTNGLREDFDAIIFATGYRSTVGRWLKDEERLFNENGMPKRSKPDHWKGEDGLYCAGFGSSGLFGISKDATMIAADVSSILRHEELINKPKLN